MRKLTTTIKKTILSIAFLAMYSVPISANTAADIIPQLGVEQVQQANVGYTAGTAMIAGKDHDTRVLGLRVRDILICALLVGGYLFVKRGTNSRGSDI